MIVASCPTRISLGSADHSPFAEKFGGVALSACINKRVYVILRKRNELEKYRFRVSYSKTELCESVDEIQLDIVREALKMVRVDDPLEIVYLADVPAQLGLATSSAFVMALLKALYFFKGTSISNDVLMDKAYVLERDILKQCGGFQDYICCLGGFNYLTGYSRNVNYRTLPLGPNRLRNLEEHCLLVYTGNQADSGVIMKDQIDLLKKGKTLEETFKIKTIVERTYKVVSSEEFSPMHLAPLVKESWDYKKRLSSSMTTPQIDAIEKKIYRVSQGAGLRLIGGGGGRGLLLVISSPQSHKKIQEAVAPLQTSTLKFDTDGIKIMKLW